MLKAPSPRPPQGSKPADKMATADDLVPYVVRVVAEFNKGVAGIRDQATRKARNREPFGPDSDANEHPQFAALLAAAAALTSPLRGIDPDHATLLIEKDARANGWTILPGVTADAIRRAEEEDKIVRQREKWRHFGDTDTDPTEGEVFVLPSEAPADGAPGRAAQPTDLTDPVRLTWVADRVGRNAGRPDHLAGKMKLRGYSVVKVAGKNCCARADAIRMFPYHKRQLTDTDGTTAI